MSKKSLSERNLITVRIKYYVLNCSNIFSTNKINKIFLLLLETFQRNKDFSELYIDLNSEIERNPTKFH